MLLLDAPASWCTVDDVLRAAAAGFETTLGTTSRNAALFFPGLREVEESSGSLAAAVAGLYARTDRERGVWKAPAGIGATVAGAPALAVRLDADDFGRLAAVGLNGMREIPGTGTVVWGARTLAGGDGGEPEWRYVPVRRTALHLEKSVHAGTQWAVFEPNGERLWAAVRSQVEDFLRELWRAGGFVGATEDEAFFVRCDATTTTPSDIDRGLMNLQIGFAPLRPAEFVMLTIQQRLVAADLPRVPEEQS